MATPEKALLDLVYLEAAADTLDYLRSLRLQGLDRVNLAELRRLAGQAKRPKLLRAVAGLERLQAEEQDYQPL